MSADPTLTPEVVERTDAAGPHTAVGTPVLAWPGTRDDHPLVTVTTSAPWRLGSGAWVVRVDGHHGGIALTHVDLLLLAARAQAAPLTAEAMHEFRWHPLGVREQVAGTGRGGSASCSCGGWQDSLALDNRAGRQAAEADHARHALRAFRAQATAATRADTASEVES